jgi:hypothetical protein
MPVGQNVAVMPRPRRENLNQANKLTRSYATLVEALDRHRGKGQQHVTVEHVHVHQGGQAIVGAVTQGGGAPIENRKDNPMHHGPSRMNQAPRCHARTRSGNPCRSPAVRGRHRCRMHGGAFGSGAPMGNQNARRHGRYTREAIAERQLIRALLRETRDLLELI